jgi:hypothetical protein
MIIDYCVPGSPNAHKKSIGAHEEERRKILKMLVTPQSTKRSVSSASFDSMVIKAARSAENIPGNGKGCHMHDNSVIRKESASSLQIPGLLRRTNSDSSKHNLIAEDPNGKKVVTFSQVVDQLACSFSDSSSMSDLSSCTEDFKHSVSSHVPRRTSRKLLRSSRISKRSRQAAAAAHHGGGFFGRTQTLGNTSGSEDMCESSMESIESTNNGSLTLHPLSALNSSPRNKLHKISSADSLMSMIKSLAANRMSTSTPSSPQLSETGDGLSSSGWPTPLTTPETPCPKTLFSPRGSKADQQKGGGRRTFTTDLGQASASSSPSMSPTRSSSQIMVEVLDPLNPRKDYDASGDQCSNQPTITLEVPAFSFGKCLSPIKELPSPMPTPIPSPLPFRGRHPHQHHHAADDISSSSSSSSGKSSSKRTTSLLSSRRSSFTAFCMKAANAGRRRSSTASMVCKLSMSTSDEDMMIPMHELVRQDESGCDFNEISIVVPLIQVSKAIPMITLTEPDEFNEEEDDTIDETPDEDLDLPQFAVSTPSPRPGRKEHFQEFTNEDDSELADTEDEPEPPMQIKITILSPPNSPKEAGPAPPIGRSTRQKPPPLIIPNSNFLNFVNTSSSQNVPKDAMSKPDSTSLMTMSSTSTRSSSIELREKRSKVPNNNDQEVSIKRPISVVNNNNKQLVKQKYIAEERKCLFKQSENITEEAAVLAKAMDSPKFLIPPGKFDSTPRERSQSVELPEFQLMAMESRKLSLHPDLRPGINVLIQPPTPTSRGGSPTVIKHRRGSRDDGLVAMMQSRSMAGQQQLKKAEIKAATASWSAIKLGSPPAKRSSEVAFQYPSCSSTLVMKLSPEPTVGTYAKPRSLDLGPAITITPMSELESESETSAGPNTSGPVTGGMQYLSPYTIVTTSCTSRTTSESNLSSSGYSSMASPGPSRSGSSNPLCISESEDTSTPTRTTGGSFFPRLMVPTPSSAMASLGASSVGPLFIRRPNTMLKSPSVDSESSDPINPSYQHPPRPPKMASVMMASTVVERRQLMAARYRTDSETTDEQCIPESISETHDSAIDSFEDIVDDDEEDVSPNCDVMPQISLVVQSSTESDKTVLSVRNTNCNMSDFSVPNSPGVFSMFGSRISSSNNLLIKSNLPEIVVQPCSPQQSSPSADSSPTTGVKKESSSTNSSSSSSSISLGIEIVNSNFRARSRIVNNN